MMLPFAAAAAIMLMIHCYASQDALSVLLVSPLVPEVHGASRWCARAPAMSARHVAFIARARLPSNMF